MNLKKLFLMLTFFVLLGTTAFAQSTLYVDVTNGSDAYTGVNATNNPAGTGPKATFAAARALVTNGGTIIVKAGTYAEAFDMSTGLIAATNSYTIQLSQLNANDVIAFTGGASVINKTGLTVNIVTSVGTEKITQTNAALNMTLGSINLSAASAWVLPNGATITLAATSGFTNAAPSKTTNISLVYTGGSSLTAGPESNYGSFGTGTITVNKTAGTTVTFPNAITAVAGIIGTAGNGTFSAAVTLGANDITNNGTGTLTFNGAVGLAFAAGAGVTAADLGSVVNAAGGSVVFNSTATWTAGNASAANVFPAAATTYVIDNQGAGSILFNSGTTFVPDPTTGFFNITVTAINNAGTLTLGTVTANTANGVSVIVNVINSTAAGTLNVAGKLDGALTTGNATATTNITGATSVAGIFTNAGTTALGGNNLTLSGNVAHVTVGGTVTASTGQIIVTATGANSFNGGTLANVTLNHATAAVTTFSAATTFTSLTSTVGTATFGAAVTIGTLTLNGGDVTNGNFTATVTTYNQSAGTFTLAANAASILDVKGNFSRTGGTFTAGAASLVSFTGSGAQSVNGGPLFQVSRLTFNNAGGTITVGNSIRASGAIIIATATNVDFSTLNLIMNGGAATSTITNNGTYTATGGGGVVVGGVNTVTGGVAGAGAGATYTLQGTGTYSYITIDVGAANLAEVVTTVTGVKWNGVLTLRSGTLDVATGGVDFGPTGSAASIVRYPEDSPGITVSAGTFNAANVSYDLTYTGAITGNKAVGTEITATPANVKTWTIQTTGAFLNTLPAGANLTFGGTLYIENGATLNLPTGAATAFVLSGASKTHTIKGVFSVVDGGDVLSVTGTPVTINGSTTVAHAATIGNFTTSSTNLTIADIQSFAGTFATTGSADVKLGMGGSTLAAADQVIVGAVTLGGASLTLNTNITSTAGVTQNAGVVVMGASNLIMNNNYNQTVGTITSTGGYMQFNTGATLTLVSALPYLRVNDVTLTLGSAVTISQNLDVAGATPLGTITSAGNNLTIENTMTTNAGPAGGIFTGAGALVMTGAAPTITASAALTAPSISNLTVNSTGTATLASSNTTARTFTISGVLTHTAGDLAIGINSVSLTFTGAAYTRATATGQITQSTGQLIFAGTGAQTAAQGTGFTIPNLTINNTLAGAADVTFAGGATNDFTVTGTLRLTAGSFSSTTAGKLHIGNLATIIRNPALSTLVQIPTFDGDVNLSYVTGNGAMANEAPTAASGKLNNITNAVTLATAAAATFKGTATLTAGVFNNTGGTITAASGATIVYGGGTFGQTPTVTNYNLTYTATFTTTTTEFQNGATISVDQLTVNGAAITVTLGQNRTVKNFTLTAGTFTTGAFTLTTTGNVNVSAGTFTSAAGALVFGGTTAQTFTIPAAQTMGGNLTINNAAGVTMAGGNLTMGAGQQVTFTSGVLTTGSNWIQFAHAAATQGFTRTGGWVNGNVRHAITAGAGSPTVYANGRYEFPVGTATRYRPYAITFSSANPAINPTNIIVGMVDSTPQGSLNLDAGSGLRIAGYPAYYWLVTANPSSFTSTQLFDVELTGTNIGIPYTSDQNLRIVRRQDGAAEYNPWSLQNGSTYANYSVISAPDTTAVVRTTASIGGIVTQGTRFTIGVPARLPVFAAAPATFTLAEAAVAANTIQYTANGVNSGETITGYTKVSGPTWAAVSATGLATLTPGYTDAGTATLVVRATTSLGLTADATTVITVTNTDRGPVLAAATATVNPATATTGNGVAKTLTYTATDADADVVAYSYTVTPAVSASSVVFSTTAGTLTFTPAFADVANSPFTFVVTASSGTPAMTAVVNTVFTVTNAGMKGDVNASATVTSADALLVLNYVVNPTVNTLTAEQLWAADVNNDGVVGAYDAASILVKAGGGAFLPKQSAAAGTVEFGTFTSEKGVFTLPINVANTAGVKSFYSEIQLGNSVEFTGMNSRLPEGWVMASHFENGLLKIAMAGTTPLTAGAVAFVNLSLNDKEASVNIQGSAILNDQIAGPLNAVKIREIPSEFSLSQNYPNPFNPVTSIKYAISQNARVNLVVYNILGQAVRTLVNAEQESGYYTVRWDGTNDFGGKVSSGIYIYRISAGNFTSTVKMNLLK